jgi:hypothetical protein
MQQLDLSPWSTNNTAPLSTHFTVSVDAAEGTTTGISAPDRARTVQVFIDPATRPEDLARPGHIFPLEAQPGGVLRAPATPRPWSTSAPRRASIRRASSARSWTTTATWPACRACARSPIGSTSSWSPSPTSSAGAAATRS